MSEQENEIKFDRRWIRNKLSNSHLPHIEITSFNKGEKTKEALLYEVARVSEYAINGSIITGNNQALALIYNYLGTLIQVLGLIPNEEIEEKINQFISENNLDKTDKTKLEDLKDLEF